MVQFVVLVVAIVCVGLANGSENESNEPIVLSVSNITDFMRKNPHVKLTEFNVTETSQISQRHTLGRRIYGDGVVAVSRNRNTWIEPHNAKFIFRYPTSGKERLVTFVDVHVERSSKSRVFSIDGGIGQRQIIVLVEALNTYFLSYESKIYALFQ